MVSSTPRPHFTPGKDPIPILQEAGWAPGPVWTGGKSRPHRDSIPARQARSSVAIPTELPGPYAFYDITWNNIVDADRPQTTLRRMGISCWKTKDTNTHSEYVIIISFPLQQWLHERASLLRHTYIVCLVYYTTDDIAIDVITTEVPRSLHLSVINLSF